MPNGWMDDLRFYVLFNGISVISGRVMELRLRLKRFQSTACLGTGDCKISKQGLNLPTELSGLLRIV